MHLFEDFVNEFSPYLNESPRWLSFQVIAKKLINKNTPLVIIETGCAREKDNWLGDGQSTVLWEWITTKCGGSVTSFDISKKSVEQAKKIAPNANIVEIDSIIGLRSISVKDIDLLYLDSMDYYGGIESPTHHLAELASVYFYLKKGCIIAIDDCGTGNTGKHWLAKLYLNSIGVYPEYEGLVTVWVKP